MQGFSLQSLSGIVLDTYCMRYLHAVLFFLFDIFTFKNF